MDLEGRWRNGRRCGLKIRWSDTPCGFESHPPYFGQEASVAGLIDNIWQSSSPGSGELSPCIQKRCGLAKRPDRRRDRRFD